MSGHDHGYDRDAIGKRLRRIEGQVRGIEKMVDEERYCIDILTQIGAAMTALENVGLKVLDDHVNHCVAGALASPSTAYIYDWNLLPIGQLLWEKELMSYIDYPPLQLAASYNLEQVLQQIREMGHRHPSQ